MIVKDLNLIRRDIRISVNNRYIKAKAETSDIIWFDFFEICDGPRSSHDYVEIARCYHTVFLSNIPIFKNSDEEQARRFISLIDELYDHKVNFIMSSEDNINNLYQGTDLKFPFKRTISRLIEMQSKEYLSKSHII